MNNLKLEGVRVLPGSFKNFSGAPTKFNPQGGKRTFNIELDPELAQQLIDEGWNVRLRTPRDEDEEPLHYMEVTCRFDNYPPNMFMIAGKVRTRLDEESVSELDYGRILEADLTISPYEWETSTGSGIKAYLKTGYFIMEEDDWADKYAEDKPF
jgi:hypothetical protein